MEKTWNNRAWFMVIPVLLLVAFSAVIPLMTVVNYSVQDTFGNNEFFWAGTDWFTEILSSDRFWNALARNLIFSMIILAIEVPLGILIALNMPKKGLGVPVCLVLMALPLLIPWNVVGTIWQVFGRVDIGLLGYALNAMGVDYNLTQDPVDAWITVIAMDVWHWTSLVVLLCYAGLVSIPDAYYQAAKIDGATHTQIFYGMILRLAAPILAVIGLLSFIGTSSDFLLANIILIKPEDKTLAVGLYSYVSDQFNQEWTVFAAGAVIAATPIVGLFLYLQRYIVSGLIGGAVKG